MRLGIVQQHLLVFAYRKHAARGIRDSRKYYASKSGAILSFAREVRGYSVPKHAVSVRKHLPLDDYNRLHVSFTNALKRLQDLDLIEYVTDPEFGEGEWRETFRSAKKSGGVKSIRKSTYCLTKTGAQTARRLIEEREAKKRAGM